MAKGGGSSSPPSNQNVTQTSEFPTELKPYISDILGKAQSRYEQQQAEGYQAFPGPRLADFAAEQTEAQGGITDLVRGGVGFDPFYGSSTSYVAPAYSAGLSSMGQFTPAAAAQYMSPYMQNVVDIQKREAQRVGDQTLGGIHDAAVNAGGFGGSRHAILEAEHNRNQNQLMDDIQQKGLQSSYDQALRAFEMQKAREAGGAQQFTGMASLIPQQGIRELGALAGVGAQKQGQTQRGLDIAYQQFLEEEGHPDTTLQQYQSIVRGFPLLPNQTTMTQSAAPNPNLTTQIAGALTSGAGLLGAFAAKGGQLKKVTKKADGGGLQDYLESIRMGTMDRPLRDELMDATRDRSAQREELTKAQKESLDKQKFLSLAALGARVMAAGGEGKNLASAVGEAAPQSIDDLRVLMEKEASIDTEAAEADYQDLVTLANIEGKDMDKGLQAATVEASYLGDIAKARSIDWMPIVNATDYDSIKHLANNHSPHIAENRTVITGIGHEARMETAMEVATGKVAPDANSIMYTVNQKIIEKLKAHPRTDPSDTKSSAAAKMGKKATADQRMRVVE